MANLFELAEIEDFYENLTDKQLLAIYEQGAVLGFSIEDRFAISFGSAYEGNHSWLDQMKMIKVDISVADCFCDEDGKLYDDEEPDAENILDMLLCSSNGVLTEIEAEFERLRILNY